MKINNEALVAKKTNEWKNTFYVIKKLNISSSICLIDNDDFEFVF